MAVCGKCSQPCTSGPIFELLDKSWHEDCFCCTKCGLRLGASNFASDGTDPYHQECLAVKQGDICDGCAKPITGRMMEALDKKWHPDCFICAECRQTLGVNYVVKFGCAVHPDCARGPQGKGKGEPAGKGGPAGKGVPPGKGGKGPQPWGSEGQWNQGGWNQGAPQWGKGPQGKGKGGPPGKGGPAGKGVPPGKGGPAGKGVPPGKGGKGPQPWGSEGQWNQGAPQAGWNQGAQQWGKGAGKGQWTPQQPPRGPPPAGYPGGNAPGSWQAGQQPPRGPPTGRGPPRGPPAQGAPQAAWNGPPVVTTEVKETVYSTGPQVTSSETWSW